MKKQIVLVSLLTLAACGGGSHQDTLPGIGTNPDQSVNEDVAYRLAKLGDGCPAALFASTVEISQDKTALTAKAGGQTVATGTLDTSGKVTAILLSPTPTTPSLNCSGLFKEGSFDLSCPVGESATCAFLYTRADLMP